LLAEAQMFAFPHDAGHGAVLGADLVALDGSKAEEGKNNLSFLKNRGLDERMTCPMLTKGQAQCNAFAAL
jgi:hypothetical protein